MARHELNQSEMAERIGVQQATVSRWLRNERIPSPNAVPKIADALYVDAATVYQMLGYEIAPLEVDPESREGRLIPLIRKVVWTNERFRIVEDLLLGMVTTDDINRARREWEKGEE